MTTAVVTGAASGSGYAIADTFTREGWDVYGIDINLDGLKRAADTLPRFTPIELELSDLDAVMDLCDVIPGWVDIRGDADDRTPVADPDLSHGQVEVLVNCAGKLRPGMSAGYRGRRYAYTVDSMLTAPALTTCMALPAMHAISAANGHADMTCGVVNVGSFYSIWGGAGKAGYLPAKWGLLGMTMGMGLESCKETGLGVRHVCLCPPHVNSPLLIPHQVQDESDMNGTTPEFRGGQLRGQIPAGKFAEPEDVAGITWDWLTRPSMRFITGCALNFSGALTAGFPFERAGW